MKTVEIKINASTTLIVSAHRGGGQRLDARVQVGGRASVLEVAVLSPEKAAALREALETEQPGTDLTPHERLGLRGNLIEIAPEGPR